MNGIRLGFSQVTHHRIRIEGTGFITEPVVERLRALPGGNRALMEVVISTVNFANDLAASLPAHAPHDTPEEKQKVIALALLVRLIEVVEATVILSAHGVRQDLHTLFRVFLDAYFVLANVCSDPGFVPIYFRTDEPERLKLLNAAAQHDHELFAVMNEYATEELRTQLGQRIKEEGIQAFNSYLFANNVGCAHVYDSMYRFSSPSVHSGPRCLADYVEADVEGNVLRILHRGDIETAHRVLYDTECFLLKALSGICNLFGVSHTDTIKQFETAVEAAMTEQEYPDLRLHTGAQPADSGPPAERR